MENAELLNGRPLAWWASQLKPFLGVSPLAECMALYRSLPGLRGFWPMGAFDGSGNVADQSGGGLSLTYNGNPLHNYLDTGGPYLALDGTGDYLSRADEAALDIVGTESYVASAKRGLTLGGWYRFGSVGSTIRALTSKWIDPNERAYLLYLSAASELHFNLSSNGTNDNDTYVAGARSANTWYFVAGRFTPGTNVEIFVNDETVSALGSGPASIFNSSADFRIGALGDGTLPMTGDVALQFVCAEALSDTLIAALYQTALPLFS
jgi:hypothetical protein